MFKKIRFYQYKKLFAYSKKKSLQMWNIILGFKLFICFKSNNWKCSPIWKNSLHIARKNALCRKKIRFISHANSFQRADISRSHEIREIRFIAQSKICLNRKFTLQIAELYTHWQFTSYHPKNWLQLYRCDLRFI